MPNPWTSNLPMWNQVVGDFVTLWVVIDPIGSIPIFMAVTSRLTAGESRRIALKALLASLAILAFFIIAGQLLLDALDIPLAAFQIAGGIVLFLFALTMIFGPSKPEQEKRDLEKSKEDGAIFPLAVPSLASPGAMMAVVVLTDNNRHRVDEQAITGGVLLVVLLVTLALFLLAPRIQRIIGEAGESIISRVMGMILAAVAVNNVLEAIREYFSLGPA